MSEGLNQVTLVGNLGADPEVRQAGGSSVCELRIATTESWSDRDGTRHEHTEWHRVAAWGPMGEACAKVLTKGWTVTVIGSIRTEEYEKDGQKKYSTKIRANRVIFGSAPRDRGERGNQDADPPSDRGTGRDDYNRDGSRRDNRPGDTTGGGGGYRSGGGRQDNRGSNGGNGGRDNRSAPRGRDFK